MMECLNCQYQGPPKKLYYNMDKPLTSFNKPGGGGNNRGSKASTLNASLAAALMNSMIGPTQIRRLFLEIGVDVGPASTLQNLCNQITHITKQIAADSMNRGIEEIIEQKERGNATRTMDATIIGRGQGHVKRGLRLSLHLWGQMGKY